MLRPLKNGTFVKFGNGTVRIRPYSLKSRFGGQIELTECIPLNIGADASELDVINDTVKVVLDFQSIESLDVLILKLEGLREEIIEQAVGESNG